MSGLEKVSRKEMEEFIFGHPTGDPEAEEDDSEYYILRPKEQTEKMTFHKVTKRTPLSANGGWEEENFFFRNREDAEAFVESHANVNLSPITECEWPLT